MKNYSNLTLAAALGVFAVIAAPAANSQTSTPAPIVVRQTKPKPPKAVWLKAEVIHSDRQSIIVREHADPTTIHTFTYSAGLQPKMETWANQGGFQPGDKVKILYDRGQSVALKLHGKPSKPL